MVIETKRIYEPKNIMDGYRVLVDSYWPRGFTHSSANVDIWKKELAPSKELISDKILNVYSCILSIFSFDTYCSYFFIFCLFLLFVN